MIPESQMLLATNLIYDHYMPMKGEKLNKTFARAKKETIKSLEESLAAAKHINLEEFVFRAWGKKL